MLLYNIYPPPAQVIATWLLLNNRFVLHYISENIKGGRWHGAFFFEECRCWKILTVKFEKNTLKNHVR